MQESDEDSSCSDDATSSEAADSSGPSSAAVSSGDLEEMISEAEGFGDENSLDSEEPDSESEEEEPEKPPPRKSALKPSSFVKAKKDDSEAETIKSTAKDPEPTPTKVDAGNRKDKKEKKEKKEKDSKKQKKEKKEKQDSPAALKPQAIEGLASSVATADSEAKKLYANANRNLP